MKEKRTLSSDAHNLSPCSLSSQCVAWLDEIDRLTERAGTGDRDLSLPDREGRDLFYAHELAEHTRQCASCTRALAEARQIRERQRSALRHLLAESEQVVPATTERILAAIQSGARPISQGPYTPLPVQDPPP